MKYSIADSLTRLKYDFMTGGLKKGLIFLLVLAVVAGIIALPSYLAYNRVEELIVDELGQNAEDMAITAATLIEQDADSFRTLTEVGNYQTESYDAAYYREMLATFREIKKETGVSFLFAEKKISNNEIAYIFDGQDPAAEDFSEIGEFDALQEAERSVFETGEPAFTGLVKDPVWGYYISGFAAVKDPETGSVLGVVGVDYSLDYITNALIEVRRVFLLGVSIIILLTAIILFRLLHFNFETQENDYITGLRNRHFHEVQLRKCIRESKLSGKPLSLVMLDLDDFKQVNDRHGHLTGDAVLKAIARVLKSQTRDTDTCSRYGGDEFVIILPDANSRQAAHIGERIREVVQGIAHLDEAKDNLFSTVSIGVAQWTHGMNAEKLTDCADKALYISKNEGRNRVTVYSDGDEMPGIVDLRKKRAAM